ncbi:molybdopterin molybdotransferase MoeA [Clostridium polynesiense]|uniref:molybdopterin molybdotransferase MoeA n=1 Tax=Clostridium polynesiense TaxID=1325933 RepID=UPI00059072AC|nr:molybdopterin molybdotransferase MoeA [Clostridium polynesiense]
MNLLKVMDIKEVLETIRSNFSEGTVSEKVELSRALGRIVCEDLISEENIPGFRRSSVDGYGINSKASAGASEAMPSLFNLKGEVKMGETPKASIKVPGDCIYVPTGGMVPEGADSIVMIEYTESFDDDTILINKPACPGENLIDEDDDIEIGETIISKGTVLRAYEIAVLSSLGKKEIPVYKKLKCGIISTGDEVVMPDIKPKPGQVRDINSSLLSSLVEQNGGVPCVYGIYNDDIKELTDVIDKAAKECDVVLISGGSSVGKKDETLETINNMKGSKLLVRGIAIKPGKPTLIAKIKEKVIFGLPGHPLACAVIFNTFVKEYFNIKYTSHSMEYPLNCTFSVNYHKAKGREEFLPVKVENSLGELIAVPIISKSAIMSAFSRAFGYIRIEKNIEGINKGERVLVYKL